MTLFTIGFAIRTIGVDHGAILGDERINEAAKVLTGQLVPDHHFYPPLLNYVTAVVYGGMFAIGKVLGIWPDPTAFRAQYFIDPTIFNVAGRVLVAAIAALTAPIAYWFARRMDYSKLESLFISAFLLVTPISVYLSYIFKGDPGLASFSLLSVSIFVIKVKSGVSPKLDVALALVMVLALSFKHSYLFLMLPLAVSYLACVIPSIGAIETLKSVLRIFITGLIAWPILNIGIVLDFQNFLAFQKVQSVMSITSGGTFVEALQLLWSRMIHWQSGIGVILSILFATFPLVALGTKAPRALIAAWGAVVLGMVLVVYLVRLRQPEHLWVSYFVIMVLFAGITLVEVTRLLKPLGVFVGATALGIALVGCIGIWQQTLARPMTQDIAASLTARYTDRKVATGIPLPQVPQSRVAQDYEFSRHQKTAEKYKISLPPLSEERIVPLDRAGTQFILPLPNPMSGLENARDEDLIGNIQPYAWPPQITDWRLDAWIEDGVDVFVVSNLAFLRTETTSDMLRAFYNELNERCQIAERFHPRKPLFLERETVIMDCANAR
ncbi:MAG: hypothetical protein JXQ85_13960 [Cognatishimia sp.]|uniref:hypothetical protein n=1 Tax=Cognatishimia sp. TaxID=2211648 RepID=UPI003B8D7D1C